MIAIRRFAVLPLVVFTLMFTFACTGMTPTQQSTLSGGAIGAAGGAGLAAIAGGNPAVGAVVGGGLGAVTGYMIGEHNK
jgi:osmotically inducible lipoprotein OsmB